MKMDRQPMVRALLIILAVTLGVIAGLVAGIVSRLGGSTTANAIKSGSVTFVATVTLVMILLTFVFS